ncbi:MAG: DJ-1/PfpI family protein [Pseudomonadota bacterium]
MRIGFVIFPGVTQLDFTGPLQFLGRMPGAEARIIAKTRDPVSSDSALTILPSHDFTDAGALDLICVPGGFGIPDAIADVETLAYVRETAASATYVTSVCTGALLLGSAGLLAGKRATTHWAYTSLLGLFGASHVDQRVVRDGNTFTGGGVTAGIDFALTLIQAIHGQSVAEAMQLGFEYDPNPPVQSGHPSRAAPETLARVTGIYTEQLDRTRDAITAALNA